MTLTFDLQPPKSNQFCINFKEINAFMMNHVYKNHMYYEMEKTQIIKHLAAAVAGKTPILLQSRTVFPTF